MREPDMTVRESDANFLARLRDRIVNQGMKPLIETKRSYQLYEQEPAAVGGKAKGIEHLEDYVFRSGSAGVDRALQIADSFYDDPKTGSVKWDGKPAVVFGRKPETGEFVLTDDSGFGAVGYDGLFTSTRAIANNLSQRDAYAPGNDLIVALFTHFAHNAMHFSDHVFDVANFLFHCFYFEFQHAVTLCT